MARRYPAGYTKVYKRLPKSVKLFVLVIILLIALLETFFGDIVNDYLRFNMPSANLLSSPLQNVKKINSIHDGDTINIVNENGKKVKIRLYGIDAPEIKQAYGEKSRHCLEDMLFNKKISYAIEDKDKYGRIVATIYADNVNVNYEMIKKGCAWSYFQYSKSLRNEFAQFKAKYGRIGLWAQDNPQAPWEYRKENR